ncbi:PD-(D/E)XK nuclease family protein [Acidobacteria bacterium AH-259-A15]|nr:PD-(D/E)XK nuclease family protein [Acidobacteria bacterium AH-259-A15]
MNNWGEILKISKSQLTTYLQCPRKYRYQYVEGREWEFMPAALAFGKAIHQAASKFYLHFQRFHCKPSLEDVLMEFIDSWNRASKEKTIKMQGSLTEEDLAGQGIGLLKLFYEEIRPRQIYAVELPFTVDLVDPNTGEISEVKLVGYLDLVEKDEEGNVIVAEIKTAARRYSETEGENKLDGFTYTYALKQMGIVSSEQPLLIRYDVLVKTKNPSLQQVFYNRGPEEDRRFLLQIQEVLHGIEAGVFYPNFGWWCAGCPFQKPCFNS